ncbi:MULTISPECIES: hypothetical protein [unclassified Enterococcus]|uniref:hypothetical protein n=1 Tax=unclassified Enterococcus TaxID=2608891 RepID=UPI001552D176|nr:MULTISPECIES: hypothetical protein [unclassified Enterococcus]MBS7576489.1 hypothetical protein [Enterococcus sp. MMGLQ5-2]MBS7583721.1 hypothetical protein [Enterococcus sp. MMGLQ5-1]NPD11582.1 hypothetical protein [Enterococcus sp. MMGLQ5-1]NPD36326.1 hypothetical protein [Enterococcus sp. MMGLQ5-2]
MITFIIGFAFLGFILFYAYSNSKQSNQNQGLQETLQAALLDHQDYSERVEGKAFYLDKKNFERAFTSAFLHNQNFNVNSNQKVEFSYLKSLSSQQDNAISGVKVKVSVNKQIYQGTVIIENGEDNN